LPDATQKDIVQWDYGSWPGGLPKKDGANALSGAGALDTATTHLNGTSRTKNLRIEFKEWVPGKHVILEKNPHYFKPGLPYLDRLEYRIMKDPLTASTALRAGEIDFFARVPRQQGPI